MYKIRKVDFLNHPILGNLSLNFCDANGHAVDTVIFAGENGVGKSTILNALYGLISHKLNFEANIEYELGGQTLNLKFYWKEYPGGNRYITIRDDTGKEMISGTPESLKKYPLHGIFSDVDINFQSNNLTSVTSLTLDRESGSRRSSNNLPTEIKQLIIDIQALDDADIAYWVKTHPNTSTDSINIHERMPRFTIAFGRMFKCSSVEAIQDAFEIHDFDSGTPTVYLEGRTDEKYFEKTAEVFNLNLPFQFRWIGYIDGNRQEVNTGKDSINRAVQFLIAQNLPFVNIALLDSDTNVKTKSQKNVIVSSIHKYDNAKGIKVGIENALVLDDVDVEQFRKQNKITDEYGGTKIIPEFLKMQCCDYICNLDPEEQKKILINLKAEIDTLKELFEQID